MTEDIAAEIQRVRARVSEVRKERMAAQRRAADRTTVNTALERTSRDRSALSSPDIEVERERVQRLHDELVELYGSVDYTRVLLERVKSSTMYADTAQLDALLAVEQEERDARTAARAGEGGARG